MRQFRFFFVPLSVLSAVGLSMLGSEPRASTGVTVGERPVILLTSHSRKLSELLRTFEKSDDFSWNGENWESRGYDIVAEVLPSNERNAARELERLTARYHPVALLSFGDTGEGWELETLATDHWSSPTLRSPIAMHLPYLDIVEAVRKEASGLEVWVDETGDTGTALDGYIAWLGGKYAREHMYSADVARVRVHGFIHVGRREKWTVREQALSGTLRAVIGVLPQLQKDPKPLAE